MIQKRPRGHGNVDQRLRLRLAGTGTDHEVALNPGILNHFDPSGVQGAEQRLHRPELVDPAQNTVDQHQIRLARFCEVEGLRQIGGDGEQFHVWQRLDRLCHPTSDRGIWRRDDDPGSCHGFPLEQVGRRTGLVQKSCQTALPPSALRWRVAGGSSIACSARVSELAKLAGT